MRIGATYIRGLMVKVAYLTLNIEQSPLVYIDTTR